MTSRDCLKRWKQGDAGRRRDGVFALVTYVLRALSRRQLACLNPGQTLAPAPALVHEAYMKFAERSAPAPSIAAFSRHRRTRHAAHRVIEPHRKRGR
jgi:hypothetical protein